MRYSLHNIRGHRIGEAETAQGIADMAKDGTFSYDTSYDPNSATAYPYVAYTNGDQGLIGTAFRYRTNCIAFLRDR